MNNEQRKLSEAYLNDALTECSNCLDVEHGIGVGMAESAEKNRERK